MPFKDLILGEMAKEGKINRKKGEENQKEKKKNIMSWTLPIFVLFIRKARHLEECVAEVGIPQMLVEST